MGKPRNKKHGVYIQTYIYKEPIEGRYEMVTQYKTVPPIKNYERGAAYSFGADLDEVNSRLNHIMEEAAKEASTMQAELEDKTVNVCINLH